MLTFSVRATYCGIKIMVTTTNCSKLTHDGNAGESVRAARPITLENTVFLPRKKSKNSIKNFAKNLAKKIRMLYTIKAC